VHKMIVVQKIYSSGNMGKQGGKGGDSGRRKGPILSKEDTSFFRMPVTMHEKPRKSRCPRWGESGLCEGREGGGRGGGVGGEGEGGKDKKSLEKRSKNIRCPQM